MAKQLVNPVERHVEKVVVVVAGGLLIAAVAQYLVTSPNRLQLGGQAVTPATVDQVLAQKAADVRDKIRRADVGVEAPAKLLGAFEKSADPFSEGGFKRALPTSVVIGPEVPIIDAAGPTGKAPLVSVQPLSQVTAVVGRSTLLFQNPDGTPRHVPSNWVTLSALFDVKSQMAEQQQVYGATRKGVLFGPLQVQRRQRRPDGTWSDDDWKDVVAWPARSMPNPPRLDLTQDDQGRVTLAPEKKSELDRYLETLAVPATQLEIVRPLMHPIVNGDRWAVPVLTNYRDVLMQDDYYLMPNDPPSADPPDRYRTDEPQRAAGPGTVSGAKRVAQELADIERLLKAADQNNSENEALNAYNKALDLQRDSDASAADREKAKKAGARAEQLAREIKRRNLIDGGAPAGPKPGQPQPGEKEPPKRVPPAMQQLWVHDAQVGSLEPARVYQYRLRPRVQNGLVGLPERFTDPTNATRVFAEGPWTAPVEVAIPRATEFYFTSDDQRNQQVSAQLFQWFDGVWVTTRKQCKIGDRLAGTISTEVPPVEAGAEFDRFPVDYKADAVIIDIDFQRPYREAKRVKGKGVKFGAAATDCCVIFADSSGRLHERFVPSEKTHPDKAAAEERSRAWRTPGKRP